MGQTERRVSGVRLCGVRGAALNDIRQALDDFDFDQALQVLDRLLLRLQDEDATAS